MGAKTPPTAAMMGSSAWRMFVSSPTVSSYFTSKPTKRKNTAMNTSLITCASDISTTDSPKKTPTCECQNSRNGSCAAVFVTMSAATAASSMAPAAFVDECVSWMSFW